MNEFRSRGVRSLVELHERELKEFMTVWKRFVASGKPMPEAHGDPDYESPERLAAHVQGAARSYLLWIWEVLEQPIEGLPRIRDAALIVPRIDAFMDETLAGWRRHLAPLGDAQIAQKQYLSRWNEPHTLEQMLEHAVVHPMRHRIQLERILAG
ncbi:MAG: hypothetical protein ACREOU_12935 [Candidatus Eiseniibacteriota bacterium]